MDKKHRVRKNEDFQVIIKDRKSLATKNFVVYYKVNDLSSLRVGVSVSKKLGNAVVRNKIKRQVRMMARDVFDFNQNVDYIIIVRKNYLNCSYEDNKNDLIYLRNRIRKRMGE